MNWPAERQSRAQICCPSTAVHCTRSQLLVKDLMPTETDEKSERTREEVVTRTGVLNRNTGAELKSFTSFWKKSDPCKKGVL